MIFVPDNGYHKFRYAKKIDRDRYGDVYPEAYWEYRRQWEENPGRFLLADYPLHLGIEITTYCNLKCDFCVRTMQLLDNEFKGIKHMPWEIYQTIVDESARNRLYGFCLNGMGEPLMHPELVSMIRYAKEKGGFLDVMFHTNAMLLTPKISEAVIKAGLDQIIFSIDGSSSQDYEKHRVGARYEQVVQNVRDFRAVRDRLGRKLPIIRVTMIINSETTEENLDRFVNQWDEIADLITFQELAILGRRDGISEHSQPKFVCTQPWQRMAIDVHGNIIACCEAINYHGNLVLGRIGKDSIKEVWQGKKINRLRQLHRSGLYSTHPFCAKCSIARGC
jgi:radical SAM protein with 4Fe4S-binding SPASM domain